MFVFAQTTLVSLLAAVLSTSVAGSPVAIPIRRNTIKSGAEYIRFSEQIQTPRCMEVKEGLFQNNQPVEISYCNVTDASQHWKWSGDNLVTVSDTGKNYCLDAGDATQFDVKSLVINECDKNTATQNWDMSIAASKGYVQLLKLKVGDVCVRVPSHTDSNADLQAGGCDFEFGINQGWTYI